VAAMEKAQGISETGSALNVTTVDDIPLSEGSDAVDAALLPTAIFLYKLLHAVRCPDFEARSLPGSRS